MINCIDFEAQIPEYLDGELTEAETAEFEAHLEGCPSCQKALEDTRALFADIKHGAKNVPAELKKNVMAAVSLEKRTKKYSGRSLVRTLGGVAASLVVVIGVAAAFPLFMQDEHKLIGSVEMNDAAAPQYSMNTSNPSHSDGAEEKAEEEIVDESFADEDFRGEVVPDASVPETEAPSDGAVAEKEEPIYNGAPIEEEIGSADDSGSKGDPMYGDTQKTESAGASLNDRAEDTTTETFNEYSDALEDQIEVDLGAVFMTRGAAGLAEYLKSQQ